MIELHDRNDYHTVTARISKYSLSNGGIVVQPAKNFYFSVSFNLEISLISNNNQSGHRISHLFTFVCTSQLTRVSLCFLHGNY